MSIESRRERRNFKNFVPANEEEAKYYEAAKRVRRIKGFYTHAIVFVVVNIMVFIINVQHLEAGETYFQWRNVQTFWFWGIGKMAT